MSKNSLAVKYIISTIFIHRVDPAAICDKNETLPIEIAITKENLEISVILSGITEVPENLKFDFLRICLERSGKLKPAEQFKKTLESMSLDEVGQVFIMSV